MVVVVVGLLRVSSSWRSMNDSVDLMSRWYFISLVRVNTTSQIGYWLMVMDQQWMDGSMHRHDHHNSNNRKTTAGGDLKETPHSGKLVVLEIFIHSQVVCRINCIGVGDVTE